ncbi:MAG: hypothetical protein H7A43_05280 [Verrucomicrobia bacterium]|nr:hypothetical protein [Verrucomicrobiota bacterium]
MSKRSHPNGRTTHRTLYGRRSAGSYGSTASLIAQVTGLLFLLFQVFPAFGVVVDDANDDFESPLATDGSLMEVPGSSTGIGIQLGAEGPRVGITPALDDIEVERLRRQLLRGEKITPRMWQAILNADLSAAQGDWEKATGYTFYAVQLLPEQIRLLERLARILMVRQEYPIAAQVWFRITRLEPLNEEAHWQLFRAMFYEGLKEQAWNLGSQMLGKNPDHAGLKVSMLAMKLLINQPVDLANDWPIIELPDWYWIANTILHDESFQLQFTPSVLRQLASLMLYGTLFAPESESGDDPNQADDQVLPRLAEVRRQLIQADADLRNGYVDQALNVMNALHASKISIPYLDASRTYALALNGQTEEAVQLAALAIQNHAGNAGLLIRYATVFLETKAYQEALPIIEKAEAAAPERFDCRFAKALALAGAGSPDKGLALLNELAESHPLELTSWIRADFPALAILKKQKEFPELLKSLQANVAEAARAATRGVQEELPVFQEKVKPSGEIKPSS